MVAEIKGPTSGIIPAPAQRPTLGESAAANSPVQSNPAGDDNVLLTRTASELREIEQAVRAAPDVDTEKVNRIRQAIADGTYQVDQDKLVNNLLRHEMMMASGGKTGGKQ